MGHSWPFDHHLTTGQPMSQKRSVLVVWRILTMLGKRLAIAIQPSQLVVFGTDNGGILERARLELADTDAITVDIADEAVCGTRVRIRKNARTSVRPEVVDIVLDGKNKMELVDETDGYLVTGSGVRGSVWNVFRKTKRYSLKRPCKMAAVPWCVVLAPQ